MDFTFLKSNRFWAMVIGALAIYLKVKGWMGEAEMTLIVTLAGGFITVRTIDRASETVSTVYEEPTVEDLTKDKAATAVEEQIKQLQAALGQLRG